MKRFVIGFGVPRDRITQEPVCYGPVYNDRECARPGCNKGLRKGDQMRWVRNADGDREFYEHVYHKSEDERMAVDNGLVVAPRDRHGKRSLYLVFNGESQFLKRLTVAEVGFVVAIGSSLGEAASRISLGRNEGARGER